MCNQLQTTIDSRFGTLRWWSSTEGKVTDKGQRYFIEGFVSGRFRAENGNM